MSHRIVAAASVAAIAAALAGTNAAALEPAGTQTLTLSAKQTRGQASWQQRDWLASRKWCNASVHGTRRWRLRIKDGVCGTAVRTEPLTAGQTYEVVVSGLASYWGTSWRNPCGTPIRATEGGTAFDASTDAQWTFATNRPRPKCRGAARKLPAIGTAFRINLDAGAAPRGWRFPWSGRTRKYVRTDHAYALTVRGAGGPIWFSFYDHQTTDNAGGFTITVRPVAAAAN